MAVRGNYYVQGQVGGDLNLAFAVIASSYLGTLYHDDDE